VRMPLSMGKTIVAPPPRKTDGLGVADVLPGAGLDPPLDGVSELVELSPCATVPGKRPVGSVWVEVGEGEELGEDDEPLVEEEEGEGELELGEDEAAGLEEAGDGAVVFEPMPIMGSAEAKINQIRGTHRWSYSPSCRPCRRS
jgi:hypothetical protein